MVTGASQPGPVHRGTVLVDVALAAVVAGVDVVAISIASEPGARAPDPVAYTLGALIGCFLVARRRWPLGVLLASAAVLFAYYALRYPGISPAPPLAVALYSAAVAGRLWWAVGVVATFTGVGMFVRLVNVGEPVFSLLPRAIEGAGLLVAVILLGETVRTRRLRLAEAAERLRLAEAEREHEAARRVVEERLRIAREMHDVLGHTVAAITVQAALAVDLLGAREGRAREAVGTIRALAKDASGEVRAAVGLLRSDAAAPVAPAHGLDRLDELVASVGTAGPEVRLRYDGDRGRLPAMVDAAAYRIVQESLTNVVRHANAARVDVVIGYRPGELVIEVADDGQGAPDQWAPGHGLTGMTERVAALNGSLRARPAPDGGFRVVATLPLEEL